MKSIKVNFTLSPEQYHREVNIIINRAFGQLRIMDRCDVNNIHHECRVLKYRAASLLSAGLLSLAEGNTDLLKKTLEMKDIWEAHHMLTLSHRKCNVLLEFAHYNKLWQ